MKKEDQFSENEHPEVKDIKNICDITSDAEDTKTICDQLKKDKKKEPKPSNKTK